MAQKVCGPPGPVSNDKWNEDDEKDNEVEEGACARRMEATTCKTTEAATKPSCKK